jgi:hypothetical protein
MSNPADVLERTLCRDAAIRAAGHDPGLASESQILEFIVKYKLYDSAASRQWILDRAQNEQLATDVAMSIWPLVEQGHVTDAIALFSSLVGLDGRLEWVTMRDQVAEPHSMLRYELDMVLTKPGLVTSNPFAWGTVLVRLLSFLLRKEQGEEPRGKGTAWASGGNPPWRFDRLAYHRFYESRTPTQDFWAVVAKAIEGGLACLLELSDGEAFRFLADELVKTAWGLAISQPLVALYDYLGARPEPSWQKGEAMRLLCLEDVERPTIPMSWRRLLRKQLLSQLDADDRDTLLKTIRDSQADERVRIIELSDFAEYGGLTDGERSAIQRVSTDGELFAPSDPRELRTIGWEATYSNESLADSLVNQWLYPEDRSALRLLVETDRVETREGSEESASSVFARLDALNTLLARPERDSQEWFGQCLEWCTQSVRDITLAIRVMHDVPKDTEISASDYLQMLMQKAPWWENRVLAAIGHIRQSPPMEHASSAAVNIGWNANDPIACSLIYLDEVLAVPDGSDLDIYRRRLGEAIREAWGRWPDYTRCLAVTILRTYHWANWRDLVHLPSCLLETATSSEAIEIVLHHLLRLGMPGITTRMQLLLNRIGTLTDPPGIAFLIGTVIGDAVVRYRANREDVKDLADMSRWYDDLSENGSHVGAIRGALLTGILDGAKSRMDSMQRLEWKHAETWLLVVTRTLANWLDLGAERMNRLPVLPVTLVREMEWTEEQRAFLFAGITDILLRIIREADLGGFYWVHRELQELLNSQETRRGVARTSGLASDETLVRFCSESARRVAQWWKEGRKTNDIAYVRSLGGADTSALITLAFETAADRENMRRELAPVIDILADAGLRDSASRLRERLRHS